MRARLSGWFFAVLTCLVAGCVVPTNPPCSISGSDSGEEGMACAACTSSAACSAESPICDEALGICRACTAGEDRRCRERGLELGRCVAGRCVACVAQRDTETESADCSRGPSLSTAPICDRNACRPCERHSECLSGVCAKDDGGQDLGVPKGSCVPAEYVVSVDQELCSAVGPAFCTPQQAFARLSRTQRYLLLRRSAMAEDFSGLTLGNLPGQSSQVLYVIGPLADRPPHRAPARPSMAIGGVATKDGLTITQGRVVLEGLFVRKSHIGVNCTGKGTKVQIVRSFFGDGNDTAIAASGGCTLSVLESWIGSGPAKSSFDGLPGNARGIDITGADFQVINTVFVDDGDYRKDALGGIFVHGLGPSGARSTVINTTFHQQRGRVKGGKYYTSLLCDGLIGERLAVFNSLFFADQPLLESPEEHYIDRGCGARLSHLGSNDPTLADDIESVVFPTMAPLFVDRVGRDLRPVSGSEPPRVALSRGGTPWITAGGERIFAPNSDLDGQPRGQLSDQVAIGAFEPVVPSASLFRP